MGLPWPKGVRNLKSKRFSKNNLFSPLCKQKQLRKKKRIGLFSARIPTKAALKQKTIKSVKLAADLAGNA